MKRVIALACLALSGCLSTPQYCDVGYTHGSHPLKGPPFGPEVEDSTMDFIGPGCRWESGKASFEGSVNYMLPDGDFKNTNEDNFVFIGRVAYKIWEPKQ